MKAILCNETRIWLLYRCLQMLFRWQKLVWYTVSLRYTTSLIFIFCIESCGIQCWLHSRAKDWFHKHKKHLCSIKHNYFEIIVNTCISKFHTFKCFNLFMNRQLRFSRQLWILISICYYISYDCNQNCLKRCGIVLKPIYM